MSDYNSDSIKILKGLDAVRKRPGMYIGDTGDGTGLHHMVFEVVDNAIDEALAGHCDDIHIVIHADNSVSVLDNGRGIPTGIKDDDEFKRSAAEIVMTELHAGGKFDANSYKVSGGLHGVGVSVVNALSAWLKLKIWRNGKAHQMEFRHGVPVEPLRVVGDTERKGTEVHFMPATETFTNVEYHYDILAKRLRELSFLNNGVKIELSDQRDGRVENFAFSGGVKGFVEYMNRTKTTLHPKVFHAVGEKDGITVEVAMQWNDAYTETVQCFTNDIPQRDGGTHLTGLRQALTRTLNNYIEQNDIAKKAKVETNGDDMREGLTCVLSVKVYEPKSPPRPRTSWSRAKSSRWSRKSSLQSWPNSCWKILSMPRSSPARSSKRARTGSRPQGARHDAAQRRAGRHGPARQTGRLPGKRPRPVRTLSSRGRLRRRLGETGPRPKFQAILPLKGKILNVERARFDRLISSQEIATLITALGTSIGKDEYNPEKLRYHRIIIMTDADVDGSHIRTLLLTFFYRQMPELVERGHIYIAQPPLYKIKHGRQERYLKDEHDLKEYLLQLATADAELVTESGKAPLTKEAFEAIAKEYLLSEAVIDRLARVIDRDILAALLKGVEIDLSGADTAEQSARNLERKLPGAEYEISAQYDERNESHRLVIRKQIHGNFQVSQIDQDFVESGSYAQLRRTSHVLIGLLGPGAYVKRGEQQQAVSEFKQALDWLLNQVKNALSIQRYKGLGEMNPEQLWETTMDPAVRRLLKVQVDDAIGADEIFTTLMGDQVDPRRQFIETNALIARNIDV